MRKIAASYIYPVTSAPIKNGILIIDSNNCILDVVDTKGVIKEIAGLEFYSGIIVPGFVDVFTLLYRSAFTTEDFADCITNNFFEQVKQKIKQVKPEPDLVKKGVNHLQAFGTKGAADYFPGVQGEHYKQKSNILFRNVAFNKFPLSPIISRANVDSDTNILLNTYTIKKNKNLNRCYFEKYCIGTGSLGTHQKLSVFDEMKAIRKHFTDIPLLELIKWGSYNGAKHLGLDGELGSLELGKKPGLNLLTKIDFQNFLLTADSELQVLI